MLSLLSYGTIVRFAIVLSTRFFWIFLSEKQIFSFAESSEILLNGPSSLMALPYSSADLEWDSRNPPMTCIDIPRNLTLCNNVGYSKMRLPNLLEHDSLYEVSEQAASWIPLLNIRCHPDTRRFICSLFCPVCLDIKIYPCRSLCENVKSGCESRMKMYGFPWPDMFSCKLFPKDNDMCITSEIASNSSETDSKCKVCEQTNTIENVLDHYCQSSFGKILRLFITNIGTRNGMGIFTK